MRIRILPLTFFHIWPSNAPEWPSKAFHFDVDPNPDQAFHFDADPDIASQNDADPDRNTVSTPRNQQTKVSLQGEQIFYGTGNLQNCKFP